MTKKDYCTAENCSYRKQVDKKKAFCMFPKCPRGESVTYRFEKNTTKRIIEESRAAGLIP